MLPATIRTFRTTSFWWTSRSPNWTKISKGFKLDGLQLVLGNNSFSFFTINITYKSKELQWTLNCNLRKQWMLKYIMYFEMNFQNTLSRKWSATWTTVSFFLNRSCDDLFKIYKLLNDLHKNIQFTMRKSSLL